MKFLRLFIRPFHIPFFKKVTHTVRDFPITEKVLFFGAVIVFIVSATILILNVNAKLQVEIPTRGGVLREGIVGTPRFINPVLAISDADRDLSALVFSGLTKSSIDGSYSEDLAQSYSISEDGTIYTFILKDNLTFQDGEPLTTEDVAFTIAMAQNSLLKSPKSINWQGVSVRVLSDKEIQFILPEKFEPFIENTTLGILPKHIWSNITADQFQFSQFNTNPIGSGSYRVRAVRYSSGGLPTHYELSPFKDYALGEAFINRIIIRLYQTNDQLIEAYNKGDIDSLSGFSKEEYNHLDLKKESTLLTTPIPRIFGVFFNQNEDPALLNREVREALDVAVNREAIVSEVFGAFAEVAKTALPGETYEKTTASPEVAREMLTQAGWEANPETNILEKKTDEGVERFSFSISTSNVPELVRTAELLQEQWNAIGADVQIKIFEINDLNQDVIRPRNYDALLFGLVLGRNTDLYSFWHSSGRTDPGLNVAQYTNITVDKIVEDVRVTSDSTERQNLFSSFIEELEKDIPAVFVYSPYFTYILPDNIQRAPIGNVVLPSDRWNGVQNWYIETEKVWKIFID